MKPRSSFLPILLVVFMLTVSATPQSQPATPLNGGLVINEIMPQPASVREDQGEWFEIKNLNSETLNLNGCSFTDNVTDSFTLNQDVYVTSGDYFVFCVNQNNSNNGGLPCDYQWSNFSLNNLTDSIIIVCESQEIDRVDYATTAGWPVLSGASMAYNRPDASDPDNNLPTNWKDTPSTINYGDGDAGTPGEKNHDWMDGIGGPTALTLVRLRVQKQIPAASRQAFMIPLLIVIFGLGMRALLSRRLVR